MREKDKTFRITQKSIDDFIATIKNDGATDDMIRRCKGEVQVLFEYLGCDPVVSPERLRQWRQDMENRGYSSVTIQNYVKHINRYLRFVGCEELCFKRGRAKELYGMTFGFLKAIEPTGAKYRGDNIWRCQCRCGNYIDVPATSLLMLNTRSCGCAAGIQFVKHNKYIDNTSLASAFRNETVSIKSSSGYVGVTKKRDKWHAYITYKGKHYSLGCYDKIEDAVEARAVAKKQVIEDAKKLLAKYEHLHRDDVVLPNRSDEPKPLVPQYTAAKNAKTGSPALRSDNTSGHTGVYFTKGKWNVRICHQGYRYNIGYFDDINEAVDARNTAKASMKEDAEAFIEEYLRTKKRHPTK